MTAPSLAEVFNNPTVGISIEKPEAWHILSAQENSANLNRADVGTPELQEAIRKHASIPLFAFVKYPEPFSDVNPSIKLNTRPAGSLAGKSGKEILEAILPPLQAAMADFILVTAPEETYLDGIPTGHASMNYTLKSEGKAYPASSEMWITPQSSYLVIVGAGYRQNNDAEKQEVLNIVKSIK